MKKKKSRKPRVVTVYQKLWESGIEFSITDLKRLNGGTYYLDWLDEHPDVELDEMELLYQGKKVRQFLFPASFEEKIESKIFFHFQRKANNLQMYPLEGKAAAEENNDPENDLELESGVNE